MKPHTGDRARFCWARSLRCKRAAAVLACSTVIVCSGCGAPVAQPFGNTKERVIYGADDRKEYFEIGDVALQMRITEAVVALIPKASGLDGSGAVPADAPSLAEVQGLCPEERFTNQPALAFCSGVLVDSDLVLTAGHCVHQLALEDFAIVFDYFYRAPGQLALNAADLAEPMEVVAEALPRQEDELRLDYAWIRLRSPAPPPHLPAPLRTDARTLELGAPVVSVSTGGGIPMKVDAGGEIRGLRPPFFDYFIVDSDSMHGSSGGIAFDAQLRALGILVRGGDDWIETPEGCRTNRQQPDPWVAEEQFVHTERALEGLCRAQRSRCTPLCEDNCRAPASSYAASGCQLSLSSRLPPAPSVVGAACIAMALARHRRAKLRTAREARWKSQAWPRHAVATWHLHLDQIFEFVVNRTRDKYVVREACALRRTKVRRRLRAQSAYATRRHPENRSMAGRSASPELLAGTVKAVLSSALSWLRSFVLGGRGAMGSGPAYEEETLR